MIFFFFFFNGNELGMFIYVNLINVHACCHYLVFILVNVIVCFVAWPNWTEVMTLLGVLFL